MSSKSSGPRPPRGLAYRALGAYSSLSQLLRGGPRPFRETEQELLEEASQRPGRRLPGGVKGETFLQLLRSSKNLISLEKNF